MGVLHCMALVGTVESDLLEYMRSALAKSLDRIAFNFAVIHRDQSCAFLSLSGERTAMSSHGLPMLPPQILPHGDPSTPRSVSSIEY